MGFLNLTILEFLAVLLPVASVMVALYFYDRSRKRRMVSTLRFWPQRPDPPMVTRRRKLQQPLSLLLQLLALLLLLLAIADFRFGGDAGSARHHVILLETSAWMRATTATGGDRTLMDIARDRARAYLRAIPANEPVMLVRTDGNPSPATVFTSDRDELEQAIEDSEPGWTATDLDSALEVAASALDLGLASNDGAPPSAGEVAYIGSGRVITADNAGAGVQHFRFIDLGADVADLGITHFAARRLPEDPSRWEVVVEVRNDSAEQQPLQVDFTFEKRPLGNKTATLGPGEAREFNFRIRTQQAGRLEARLDSEDSFPANNHAGIHLTPFKAREINVYSARPRSLGRLLTSNLRLDAKFLAPAAFQSVLEQPGIVILDGFVPERDSDAPTVYIDPPPARSPLPVSRVVRNVPIVGWAADHPLARGLRSRDIVPSRASVFEPSPGDVVIAESEAGPVIVARSQNGRKQVFFGFQPTAGDLENQLLTPLLFANTVSWLAPDVFQSTELATRAPGLVEVEVGDEPEQSIAVTSPENPNLPWVLRDGRLRFFAGSPGTVRVRTPSLDTQLALDLPQVAPAGWTPPEDALRGVPPPSASGSPDGIPLWPWLALAALICLAAEWTIFGRATRAGISPVSVGSQPSQPSGGLSIAPSAGPSIRPDVPSSESRAKQVAV
jgi:Ca-activated chloride channel family protein